MKRITVTQPSLPPFEEYVEVIKDIWDRKWLTNSGPKHQELQQQLSELLGRKEIALFSSGHQALEAVFSSLPAGGEVITTPFTYTSTTLAILRAGLTPVFCDIEPEYYTMDTDLIEALITDKTVAIAPVHVYGHLCDWQKIQEIGRKHNLKVIYDAAHAFGVSQGDINAAQIGDVAMFSFHATKVFNTIEGGCLACDDPTSGQYYAAWRQFGMFDGEQTEIMGTNAKMTEFAAAMGLCNLVHLKENIEKRKAIVLRYRERLAGAKGITICGEQPGVQSNYAYFPVRIDEKGFGASRDQLVMHLDKEDIQARKYFYPITSEFPLVRRCVTPQETPIAKQVSNEILCLPLYADLTIEDVDRICDRVLSK